MLFSAAAATEALDQRTIGIVLRGGDVARHPQGRGARLAAAAAETADTDADGRGPLARCAEATRYIERTVAATAADRLDENPAGVLSASSDGAGDIRDDTPAGSAPAAKAADTDANGRGARTG